MELPSRQCSARWGQHQPAVTSSAPKRLMRLTTYRLTVTFAAAVVALAATLVSPLSAAAQEARGTITGTVRDSSKGVIPGASVTITNVAMGTTVPVTNEIGWFQAPYLIPGTYRGGRRARRLQDVPREVEVRINDRLEVDVVLEPERQPRRSRHSQHATARDDEWRRSGKWWMRGASRSCRRLTVIPTPSSASRPACPTRARRGSIGPSSRPTSSATRWMARAATEAT